MSDNSSKKQIAVGVFIALGIVILVAGVLSIGDQRKAFVKTFSVRAVFDDVQGLQPGNNIWLSGMKIGSVKKVEFYGSAQVEIIMNIDHKAQQHIRRDAKVRISTDGLVGNKIVVIYGGTPGAPMVAANDVLQTEHQVGTQEMMATLQANNLNILEITGNLKTISEKLRSGQGTLGSLINDPSLGNSLKASVANLQVASANSERVVGNLQAFTAGLQRKGALANDLVTDTTIFRSLRGSMDRLNDAATAAAAFGEKIKLIGDSLDRPNTPVGVILHDEEMAADMQRTIKNLRLSSKELADDLEAVQHNWLLRGFFKKKDK
jgi:phospholipid/cholesterol/gamma-HCH transport system substrate-binding protein